MKAGVTIDPVKIDSLEQFGTPDEVAKRVLAVEEGRDGVKSVTLRQVLTHPGEPAQGWSPPRVMTRHDAR